MTRLAQLVRLSTYAVLPGALIWIAACALAVTLPAVQNAFDFPSWQPPISRVGLITLAGLLVAIAVRRKLSAVEFGLRLNASLLGQIGIGTAIGIAIMATCVGAQGLAGIRVLKFESLPESLEQWGVLLGLNLGVGLAVGFLEECLFRGCLFGLSKRALGAVGGGIMSSLYFAGLHFLKAPKSLASESSGWLDNLHLANQALLDIFALKNIDSLVALWVAGCFLCLVRSRADYSLGVCIGIHAGWVLVIKVSKVVSDHVASHPLSGLVGTYDHVIGWLAAVLLAGACGIAWLLRSCRSA